MFSEVNCNELIRGGGIDVVKLEVELIFCSSISACITFDCSPTTYSRLIILLCRERRISISSGVHIHFSRDCIAVESISMHLVGSSFKLLVVLELLSSFRDFGGAGISLVLLFTVE